jgi:hypothetical protein
LNFKALNLTAVLRKIIEKVQKGKYSKTRKLQIGQVEIAKYLE